MFIWDFHCVERLYQFPVINTVWVCLLLKFKMPQVLWYFVDMGGCWIEYFCTELQDCMEAYVFPQKFVPYMYKQLVYLPGLS